MSIVVTEGLESLTPAVSSSIPGQEELPGSLYRRPPEAADSLDRPPWNVVKRRWMASAMAPEADLLGVEVSPRTDRGALGEFAEAGMRQYFHRPVPLASSAFLDTHVKTDSNATIASRGVDSGMEDTATKARVLKWSWGGHVRSRQDAERQVGHDDMESETRKKEEKKIEAYVGENCIEKVCNSLEILGGTLQHEFMRIDDSFSDYFTPRAEQVRLKSASVGIIELSFVSQDCSAFWDGTTSHTAGISMEAVNALYPSHVISRKGNIAWPPRSPDLTVCDFFLWGHLKTKVFGGNSPRTIPALKQRIREKVAAISVNVLRGIMQQFVARLEECVRFNGATPSSPDWRPDPPPACDVILRPPQINGICSQFMCLNLLNP
ncbi:hypothetical protein ANN_11386 [Periplaneta americana]|uniref:Uncharacterized protein n=1 Tax=Periplaneta americana TaxID=6978 RepID=A0ABQ8T6L3_PERAM|nr:hypothetical protein ANN_11386 [Periplaneta americana]